MRDKLYDDRLDHFIDEKKLATWRHNAGHKPGPQEYCLACKRGLIHAERVNPTQPAGKVSQHAFSKAAEPVLRRALELVTERGGTHGDTWRLPMATPFVDMVLGLTPEGWQPPDDAAWKRLLMAAALVDIKDIRAMNGEFNRDDTEDGINYRAALTTWLAEYHGGPADAG